MPFAPYGFTLRPVADVKAAIEAAGLDVVDQRRLEEVAIPLHMLVAQRAGWRVGLCRAKRGRLFCVYGPGSLGDQIEHARGSRNVFWRNAAV